ncbi:phage tail spike protein [Clostridium cellulovorans]|uniref:Phage minor structural protein n=1 Tax=Clostridium cellulovorans (strain ATCC 35296 / DSM 3052 / OCM 3 / 743B) TaxID=573061 RepID=D9SSG9_CLOC7|nr:phage tail spike protein [Clostridium cellulovorans]ADL50566.1 phage minor structural protein [Clostridium cellulovorans 743B]
MLQLYDINHNKICGLTNYKDLKIERELSGDENLSFSYPHNDDKYTFIKEECYLRTAQNEYVIKEINVNDDWTEVVAKVNVEALKGTPFGHFQVNELTLPSATIDSIKKACANTINLALAGTGWTIGSCNIEKSRTVKKGNCSSYEILQEIRKVYLCDFKFDAINKKVYIYQSMGLDRGSYFSEELNLKKIEIQSNSYDYCTRIIPLGKDGLKITDINNGKDYVESYQYSNKVISIYWEDNRYESKESLKEDAIAKLKELSKPVKAYSVEIIDLASISDKYKNILDYDLGDVITLISKDKKLRDKQRIIKLIEYPDEPERNSCEIANRTLRFEDIQANTLRATEVISSVTTSDGMLEGSKVNSIDWVQLKNVNIMVADIQDLNAVTARIGTLETTTATITQLNAVNSKIDNLVVTTAQISDASITNAKILNAAIDTAKIRAGAITRALIADGAIGTAQIAEASIGTSHISSLTADVFNSGTIDTSKVTIAGANSRLLIRGNRLQVFAVKSDNSLYERVTLGDVNGDGLVFGFRVRSADGETVLLDENGVTREGITDGSISNEKIAGDANISGTKLDINSVVTTINSIATTTIQSSKVFLNNSTLDVQFSNLKTTVTEQGQTISTQGAQIVALNNSVVLKVDSQAFSSYKVINDSNITTINSRLSTAESSLSILQNQITLKVSSTDIEIIKNSIIKVRYIRDWINGSSASIGNHWVEIKAMRGTTNVAKNKTVTGSSPENTSCPYSRVTDDNTLTTSYANPNLNGGNQYVQIDLGAVYDDIDYLHIWHYYGDSRIYHNNKTEVSSDGTNWITLFDSSKSSEYAETSAGHVVNVNMGRIVNRINVAESTIKQNSQDILLKVDVNGVMSAINQSAEAIKIQASKIDLTGYATFTSLSTPGQTTINAGNITTGTMNASRISGGTITGALLKTSNTTDYLSIENQNILVYRNSSARIKLGFDMLYNSGLELGPTDIATTPYLDFHSSGTPSDYDCRIISSGGSSTLGQGVLDITAAAVKLNRQVMLYSSDNTMTSMRCINPAVQRYIEVSTIFGAKGLTYWDSDKRYKMNIEETDKTALDKIMKIKHYDFDYKAGLKHFDVGYISQQLMEINPQWVITVPQEAANGEVSDFYIPNQTTIIPYLSKAIQELKQLIDNQNREIKTLKKQLK